MDCLKDIRPPFERVLREKHDLGFVKCLASSKLEARTSNKKKQHDGGKKKGKGIFFNSNLEGEGSKIPKASKG
jgi:hypothetical protein